VEQVAGEAGVIQPRGRDEMKIECKVEECDVLPWDDRAGYVPGLCVTCTRCNEEAVVFGTSERSLGKALAMMRESCPNDEENFYVAEETGGESRMPEPVVKPWWEK
jgi:hypothetical protein